MMVFPVEIWKHTAINLSDGRRTAVFNSDLYNISYVVRQNNFK